MDLSGDAQKGSWCVHLCARGREREKTGLYELKGENNPSLHCKCSEILLRAKEQGRIAVSVSDNLRPKKPKYRTGKLYRFRRSG